MSQSPYPPTQPEPGQPEYRFPQYQPQQYQSPNPQQQYSGYPSQPPAYGLAVPQPNPYLPQPNPYAPQALAPFGVDPLTGLPYSDKSKLAAGLLQIFLGGLGVGRFYLGNPGMAIAQIVVTWVTFGVGYIWPLIDGIVLLAGQPRDNAGRPLRS